MAFRQLFAAAVFALSVLSGVAAQAHHNDSNLQRELDRLSNIIENNIPTQHREILRNSLIRISGAAEESAQCTHEINSNACQVRGTETGSFAVYKNGVKIGNSYGIITHSAAEYATFVNTGVCENASLARRCMIRQGEDRLFTVYRGGDQVSAGYSSELFTEQQLQVLIEKGLCL
jgi:hypothetical protein